MDDFQAQLAGLRQTLVDLDGDGVPDAVAPSQRSQRPINPNELDPMTAGQMETSRRAVADARFQQGAPQAANMAFEMTGLPSMYRGVGNIHEGISNQNAMQALGGAGQLALGALPYGSGKVLSGAIPYAGRYAEKAANMTGVTGMLARRAPSAAGLVGGVEGTKAALNAGQAVAADGMAPPPATGNVQEVQQFLVQQGYPVTVDGQRGQQTERAFQDYSKRYREFIQAQNSPEMQSAKTSLMEGQAAQARAEASRLQGVEAERRGGVLKEAEARFDSRPQTMGQKATQFAQDWAGPAIMGAAAFAGAKGIAAAPVQRNKMLQLNSTAGSMGRNPSEANRRAFVNTYDKTVRGSPVKDAATMGGVYGALGTEMALSNQYLTDARQQYDKALSEYEAASAGGNLDGGREKELADRVVKSKRDIEKWERLQGAGLHGMGYYTAGKIASSSIPKGRPSTDATQLRNKFKAELAPPRRNRMFEVRWPSSQSGLAQPSTRQIRPSGQGADAPKGQSNIGGRRQDTDQGSQLQDQTKFLPLRDTLKEKIRTSFAQNNGRMTIKQAQEIAPNVNPERLKKYLAEQRKALADLGPEKYKSATYLAGAVGASSVGVNEMLRARDK